MSSTSISTSNIEKDLRKAITEAMIDSIVKISDWLDLMGFRECMSSGVLKFIKDDGNYTYTIKIDEEKDILIYSCSNNKDDVKEEYSISNDLEVQKAIKELSSIIDGLE